LNRTLVSIGILLSLFLTSISFFGVLNEEVAGRQITKNYSFDIPSVKYVELENLQSAEVSIKGASSIGNPGEPNLPAYGAYLLVPQGKKVSDIVVTHSERICLGSGILVQPVEEPVILFEVQENYSPFFDENIYSSKEMFPGRLYTEIGTYWCRGYQILVLTLHPLQYIPATGELFFYPNLKVSFDTVEDNSINNLYRGFEKDLSVVRNKVDNPEVFGSYDVQPLPLNHETFDLLIVTTDEFKPGFEPLADFHNNNGVSTIIKTISDVGSNSSEDIRDFVRDAYTNMGIDYLLIGADDDAIPAKDLYVSTSPYNYHPKQDIEEHMPSDFYYGCLDGTFNYDGDDLWGEITDGEGGSDVDLMAEVYLGRACVDNMSEVGNFVNKTISYLSVPDSDPYLKKTLFLGEDLENPISSWKSRYGGHSMDELIDGYQNKFNFLNLLTRIVGFTSVGIPSSVYSIDKLYDSFFYDWTKAELINKINEGVRIVNHNGHGNTYHGLRLDEPVVMIGGEIFGECHDVINMTNDKYFFVYSQACFSGAFDNVDFLGNLLPYDCIAEYMTVKTEHGAFAGVFNARYGITIPISTDGMSQRFHRQFWDAVFNESLTEIGRANQDSKEDNLWALDWPCIRYLYFGLNLFGDPTIKLVNKPDNRPPTTPEKPSGSTHCLKLINYKYTTSSVDPDGDNINYIWDFIGDLKMFEMVYDWVFNQPSGEKSSIYHRWHYLSFPTSVRVKAKDIWGAESDWSEPLNLSSGPGNSVWVLSIISNVQNCIIRRSISDAQNRDVMQNMK